jgi:hypothetical protein
MKLLTIEGVGEFYSWYNEHCRFEQIPACVAIQMLGQEFQQSGEWTCPPKLASSQDSVFRPTSRAVQEFQE